MSRPGGPRLALAIGAFLLFQPACDALWHQFIQPLNHDGYDSHGDLRPDLLDYLGGGATQVDEPHEPARPRGRSTAVAAWRTGGDPGRDRRGGRRACAGTSSAG